MMGLEAACNARCAELAGPGRARLETDTLRFSGAFRLSIPLRELTSIAVDGGELRLDFGRETAVFSLGDDAPRWAEKIRNPPSVLDKLGVQDGMNVCALGVIDEALLAQVRSRASEVSIGRIRRGAPLVFLGAREVQDLRKLPALRRSLAPDGAIWVLWPKGRPELKEDQIRGAALEVGLVDVKVASVSERLSGLKLMIPRAAR